jgi:hypothetical protein
LPAQDEIDQCQRLQAFDRKMKPGLSDPQNEVAKGQIENSQQNPASVRSPIFQVFGFDEGTTLSVVDDIARKSPVIIEITTSIGIKMA